MCRAMESTESMGDTRDNVDASLAPGGRDMVDLFGWLGMADAPETTAPTTSARSQAEVAPARGAPRPEQPWW